MIVGIAIAEHVSGSVENFANLMNKKAQELGLTKTHFVTPHGLDDDNHYTTAYELAILTDYALKNDTFKNIVSTKTYTISFNGYPRTLSNTNELLGNLEGVYGVKTGFTSKAGRCLVSCTKRNNFDIIVVVLGANTKKIRTLDSKNVINYVYKNYEFFDTSNILKDEFQSYQKYFSNNYILEKSIDTPMIEFLPQENYTYPLTKSDISSLHVKTYTLTNFSPSFHAKDKIGMITVYKDDKILYSLDIVLKNDLTPNDWKYYFFNILRLKYI